MKDKFAFDKKCFCTYFFVVVDVVVVAESVKFQFLYFSPIFHTLNTTAEAKKIQHTIVIWQSTLIHLYNFKENGM